MSHIFYSRIWCWMKLSTAERLKVFDKQLSLVDSDSLTPYIERPIKDPKGKQICKTITPNYSLHYIPLHAFIVWVVIIHVTASMVNCSEKQTPSEIGKIVASLARDCNDIATSTSPNTGEYYNGKLPLFAVSSMINVLIYTISIQ